MVYKEKEIQMSNVWYSICFDHIGKRYQQWMVPCRILEISPAEYVKLLVEKFNAEVTYSEKYEPFLSRTWKNQLDAVKWRNYINNLARTKEFHI